MEIFSPSSSAAVTSLGPGFRFHPTDEELVRFYLTRKVRGLSFRLDAISEIDIYRAEPWDLPAKSRMKTKDLEWYFFSVLDKKYGNGSRMNRATESGYWKTTGKDRAVFHKSQVVGMKKTLVYHNGRAPKGKRTNWVMHEYRLVDKELKKDGTVLDAFVLCRVFEKSGSGPKNGEQYGAPFIEEEWEDDVLPESVPIPLETKEVAPDDSFLDKPKLDQMLDTSIVLESDNLPSIFNKEENSSHIKDPLNFMNGAEVNSSGVDENYCGPVQPGEQVLLNFPTQDFFGLEPFENIYTGEPSGVNNFGSCFLEDPLVDINGNPEFSDGAYLETDDLLFPLGTATGNPSMADNLVGDNYDFDGSYLGAIGNPQYTNGAFIETNDLVDCMEADASGLQMIEEYLTLSNADGQNLDFVALDSSKMTGSENIIYDQVSPHLKPLNEENDKATASNQQLAGHNSNVASSSNKEAEKDSQNSFIKQATSRFLESIPAPPAFASEFPSKDVARCLTSLSESSGVHFTTGMIQIRNMNLSRNEMELSLGKHGGIDITLSFGLSHNKDNTNSSESTRSILSSKTSSATTRGWFYFMFLCVLVLSVSFKMGTCISAH